MLRKWIYLLLLFTGACKSQTSQEVVFVENRQSKFEICISTHAGPQLMESVEELQSYIEKIAGIKLPITTEKKANHQIVIGDKSYMKSNKAGLPFQKLETDGFIIKIHNENIWISGLNEKGVINGIYTFLSEFLGCKYYARNAIYIPKKENISFQVITEVQNPAFEMRMINAYQAFSPTYCKWHKLDLPPKINPLWLKPWAHATLRYVNPKKYRETHPEFFNYVDGKLFDINYDNQEVFQITIHNLEEKLQISPQVEYISVSQADIKHNLKGVENKMNSFITLRFANKVAEKFPKKTITYLAYQYSMMPPKGVKPLDNVLVRVTNTIGNRSKAIKLKDPQNRFAIALKQWQNLTDNIMVWDYMTNTKYPLSPYPNFKYIQESIKNYRAFGVSKLFIGGEGQAEIGFQGLRNYLTAKLLWDPNVDVDSVIDEFLSGYYGDAAPFIKQYIITLTDRFLESKTPLLRTANPRAYKNDCLSSSAMQQYKSYFKKAEKAVENNPVLLERIDKLQQSLRFAQLEIHRNSYKSMRQAKSKSFQQNRTKNNPERLDKAEYEKLLEEFTEKAKKYNMKKITREHQSPKAYESSIKKD